MFISCSASRALRPFHGMPAAWAEVPKNSKATVNARLTPDGRVVTEGEQVFLGGNDAYVAMCHRCWKKKITGRRKMNMREKLIRSIIFVFPSPRSRVKLEYAKERRMHPKSS